MSKRRRHELGMVERLIWRTEAAIEVDALVEFSSREAKELVLKLLKRRARELLGPVLRSNPGGPIDG